MTKNILVSALVAIAISATGLILVPKPVAPAPIIVTPYPTPTPNQDLGGVVNTSRQYFLGGAVFGAPVTQGGAVETVTSGSYHYTATQVCTDSIIRRNMSNFVLVSSISQDTLPAASALITKCLPNKGDSTALYFENISNNEKFALNAGSGIDVILASGSSATFNSAPAKQRAMVRFTNIDGASVSASIIKLGK